MLRTRALWAIVAVIVVSGAAAAIFQPGYRIRSQCDYMRFEEECRCYSSCTYRTVTGARLYLPRTETRECPIVRAFPVFEKESDQPRIYSPDLASKDPCKNGSGIETYGSGENDDPAPKKEP